MGAGMRALRVVVSVVLAGATVLLLLALQNWLRERSRPVFDPERDQLVVRERDGSGPKVLLLHGLASSQAIWERTIRELPEPLHLIVPDLLGFGASPKPLAEYDIATHLAALDQALLRVGVEEGDELLVVGHSMGSILALAFAAERPERVSRLVLVSLPAYPSREIATQHLSSVSWMHRGMLSGNPFYELLCYSLHERTIPFLGKLTGLPRDVAEDGLEHNWISIRRSLEHVILDADTLALARRAKRPMRLIHGARDSVVPVEFVREWSQAISPHPDLIVLEDADHEVPLRAPEVIAQAILESIAASPMAASAITAPR